MGQGVKVIRSDSSLTQIFKMLKLDHKELEISSHEDHPNVLYLKISFNYKTGIRKFV